MIKFLLENDLYKFVMMNFIFYNFGELNVKYNFICRNRRINFKPVFHSIQTEIEKFLHLEFYDWEIKYLNSLGYFRTGFLHYLRSFKFNEDDVTVYLDGENLQVAIKGDWLKTILLEVPILAIINECYFKHEGNQDKCIELGKEKLKRKLALIDGLDINIADFGMRRRYSRAWHDYVVKESREYLSGTSNVYLAKKYCMKPIGTMAHELICTSQYLSKDKMNTQRYMLRKWSEFYGDKFLIALDDTLGLEKFLQEFTVGLAERYDGTRQDSGDPITNGYRKIQFYKDLGIDPLSKKIIFSDSLTFGKAIEIYNEFKGKIQVGFGIGTNFSNDVGNLPLNIVIKMTKMNKQHLIKLSDSPGKEMCTSKSWVCEWKEKYL